MKEREDYKFGTNVLSATRKISVKLTVKTSFFRFSTDEIRVCKIWKRITCNNPAIFANFVINKSAFQMNINSNINSKLKYFSMFLSDRSFCWTDCAVCSRSCKHPKSTVDYSLTLIFVEMAENKLIKKLWL